MESAVYLVTRDLFFRVKIETVAEAAGVPLTAVEVVESVPDLPGGLVIVDLAAAGVDPVRVLKSRSEPPHVVAFGSHQDREGLKGAARAGADRVMARSTFVERLPELLSGNRG